MLSDEPARGLPGREHAGDGGDDRGSQQHERRPVVDEALALDDVDEPSRHAEPLADRCGRDRIGRRDDRAEHERLRPGKIGDACATTATPTVVTRDEADREQRDRPQVLPQLAQAGEVGRHVEERRQDADEHDLRRHRHGRHARPEAQEEPPEDEQDRIRDPQRARQDEQRGGRSQQREQLQLLPRAELQDHRRLGHPDRCVHPSKLQAVDARLATRRGTRRRERVGNGPVRLEAVVTSTRSVRRA